MHKDLNFELVLSLCFLDSTKFRGKRFSYTGTGEQSFFESQQSLEVGT